MLPRWATLLAAVAGLWALPAASSAAAAGPVCAAPAPTADASAAPARAFELRHVDADLRLDWPSRSATGTATLTITLLQPAHTLALDAAQLSVQSVTLADGRALAFSHSGGAEDGALRVTLDREAAAGQTLVLRVAYRTQHVNHSDPQNLWGSTGKGLRFFQPTRTDARKRLQVWNSAEAGTQRWWLPGLDAPHSLRTSDLRITVPKPLSVVSSGDRVGVTEQPDGQRTYHWRVAAPQPAHRLSFVVGEFVDIGMRGAGSAAAGHTGPALHNHSYPDEQQATADSVVLLPDMLRFFERITGRAYPHAAFHQVFVQDLPWGHAGTGLAVQTENMVDDEGTHADFKYLWNLLQAENLAQQWFGSHLSVADWGHAWLERGFARHLAGLYAEHRFGRAEYLLWVLQADQATTLADWKAGNRDPVVLADAAKATEHAGGNAPYARGAAVLHLLRSQLGDSNWQRVLQHFVACNGGRAVLTRDLQQSVRAVTGNTMEWFFEQWVTGSGHPVFEVQQRWDASQKRLHLSLLQVQPSPQKLFQGAMDIDIGGQVQRVWLKPQARNDYAFDLPQPPRWVHVDHEGAWIKELKFEKPAEELLQQLRHSSDPVGRQWAMTELVAKAKRADAPQALQAQVQQALRELAHQPQQPPAERSYWRLRFNALRQLQALLAPADAAQAAQLDMPTRQALLAIIRDEGGWMRSAALGVLGLARDPALVPLFASHLRDRSDRVINAAAIALGRAAKGAPLTDVPGAAREQAFAALAALPAHPSWKHQSLISALAGLKELGDARAGDIAAAALADVHSPRWTLVTPIWDYRLAAAQTLQALGQGGRGVPLLLQHFDSALQDDDVNDIFYNLTLLVALGDSRARPALGTLKKRYASDSNALEAIKQHEEQLEARLKPGAPPR